MGSVLHMLDGVCDGDGGGLGWGGEYNHPKQRTSSQCYVYSKSHHFVWQNCRESQKKVSRCTKTVSNTVILLHKS